MVPRSASASALALLRRLRLRGTCACSRRSTLTKHHTSLRAVIERTTHTRRGRPKCQYLRRETRVSLSDFAAPNFR